METIIFVAGIPLRGASNICFEFSIKTLCFFRCVEGGGGEGICCDEKGWSNVGVGESKSMGCGWCSVSEEFGCDIVPPPGSRM
jgi:hypothetical protein